MLSIIRSIDRGLAVIENSLVVLVLSVMVGLSFVQIVMRGVFDSGLLWGDIFLRHLVLWVGFLGASLATRQDKHISIDVLNQVTPKHLQRWTKLAVNLVTIAVCLVLANAGYEFVMLEKEFGSTVFEEVPAWIFQIIIPIGFAMIAFRLFLASILQIFAENNQHPAEQTTG